MNKGSKIALGLGTLAAVIGGIIFAVTRKAKAAPPPAPEPGMANLYGQVTDSVTKEPVPGVLVTLDGMGTYTDSGGNYAFMNIQPGSYTATFIKEGYEPAVL